MPYFKDLSYPSVRQIINVNSRCVVKDGTMDERINNVKSEEQPGSSRVPKRTSVGQY